MSADSTQRWCHACGKLETFGKGWFELWIGLGNELTIQPIEDPANYHMRFRGDIFACGQGTALALAERYLHNGSFDPAVAHNLPLAQPEHTGSDITA